jgi:hypothetical protein
VLCFTTSRLVDNFVDRSLRLTSKAPENQGLGSSVPFAPTPAEPAKSTTYERYGKRSGGARPDRASLRRNTVFVHKSSKRPGEFLLLVS